MGKFPYYPRYVDDFNNSKSVRAMSLGEVGLYDLALDESWRSGSIPDDAEQLAIDIRRRPFEVKPHWPAVRACYVASSMEPGRLVNPYQEQIRAKIEGKSAVAAKASKASWESRRKRFAIADEEASASADVNADAQADASANANAIAQADASADAKLRASESDSDSNSLNSLPKAENPNLTESEPGFWSERLYFRHPRKKDLVLVHPAIVKVWQHLQEPKAEGMRAIDAAHARKCTSEEWRREGGRFVPSLAAWLTDRGYEEQQLPVAISNGRPDRLKARLAEIEAAERAGLA